MSKKIYDIIPPKIAHKLEDEIEALSDKGKLKRIHKKKPAQGNIKKQSFLKEVLIGSAIVFVLLSWYFISKLPKADVEIWPKTDALLLQEKITADKSADSVDLSKKIIPAQYLEQTEDGWQAFDATGSASNDSKASGTIQVYNKLSPPTSFTLIAGTHFLSDSGKYFVATGKIIVPPASKKGPGSVSVAVQAEESGPDYNIGASKFSLPKLYGTSYYYGIYGSSNSQMAGGLKGNVREVSQDDISNAKDSLTKKLLAHAEDTLKKKLSANDVLLQGAVSQEVIDASSDVKPNSAVDKFNEEAKVKFSALVFKKGDLESLIKEDIASKLQDPQTFLDSSLIATDYNPDLVDVKNGTETFDFKTSVKTYYKIDKEGLPGLLAGKSADQIKSLLSQTYGDKISQIKVSFWPFWVRSSPNDKNRIGIKLNF